MASKTSNLCLVVLVALAIASTWGGATAQTSSSCTSALMTMSSCLNYITGNSSTPASSCCSSLSNVVQSQPQCLCAALSSGAASSLGLAINQTRALGLPNVCNVKTPPVSSCKGAGGSSTTAGAPTDSATGNPDNEAQGPAADFPSAGSGSKAVPGSTSDGSFTKSSLYLFGIIFSAVISTSALF